MTQPWKDATEYKNHRRVSLVAHTGNCVILKVITGRLINYREREGILLDKQSGFRPQRSTVDMILVVVRRLQELTRNKDTPLYMCIIDLTKAYDSVDPTVLGTVLALVGKLPGMFCFIRQFQTACEHACGRMVPSARICSKLGSRVFGRGESSCHRC